MKSLEIGGLHQKIRSGCTDGKNVKTVSVD